MGTNYYSVKKCEHCGAENDRLHIGKSSAGWLFALATHQDRGIVNIDSWQALLLLQDRQIVDEYGAEYSGDEMWTIITDPPERERRSSLPVMGSYAEAAPRGYFRCRIDGRHCVAHGELWDVMRGEFS